MLTDKDAFHDLEELMLEMRKVRITFSGAGTPRLRAEPAPTLLFRGGPAFPSSPSATSSILLPLPRLAPGRPRRFWAPSAFLARPTEDASGHILPSLHGTLTVHAQTSDNMAAVRDASRRLMSKVRQMSTRATEESDAKRSRKQ
ncbi:hypothetical protein Tdes44962_MAKER07943 [Teratosphaeria destructans]|uniref:Uncharacterized protein n=1 Tax=Teratosphaeria destructans TaxID=418781 RepID=A0A9W7W5J3_9PEZI|nr:hypothetical protein Tdes44962_MAKER07943 [Teratosphaeria destructans]